MGNDVLVFLSLLNREQIPSDPTLLLLLLSRSSFLRREIAIDGHEPSHAADILVNEPLNQVHDSVLVRLGSHVKQHTVFRLDVSTEAFEKPQVRRKLGTVGVLKAGEDS